MHWVLVLILTAGTANGYGVERLEQDTFTNKAECVAALAAAARTNYTDGFYRCEQQEAKHGN